MTVPVVGDPAVEANETFTVNLSSAVGATILDGQGLGTILNDDGPLLRINDVTQAEGNGFTTPFIFTVSLAPASTSPVTVTVATANSTAVAPGDYGAITPTVLTFSPGELSQSVPVNVVGDTTVEANETFTVNLSSAVGATIFDGRGVGTILNDDTAGLTTTGAREAGAGTLLSVADSGGGDVLLYPYWSTQEQETLLTIGSMSEDRADRYVHVSLREGQSGREAAGFTICLSAGAEWTAALRSQGSGQASLHVDQPGSCDPTVPAGGFTSPPVAGRVVPIDADFGYVEAYTLGSTTSGAAALWGEATLIQSRCGEMTRYVATALVGVAAHDAQATTANTTAVAAALARADGVDKEIGQVPWTVDLQSAVGTQVVLTFPGGYQPGVENPLSLYVLDAQEQERAVLHVTLPHVVNVCTLARIQETIVVQCPAVEGEENGGALAGPLATFHSGQLRMLDTAEGEEVASPDALPVRRFPVLGLVTLPGGRHQGVAQAISMT